MCTHLKWNNQRGFSLIEVMSAAMVLSIFITAIGAIWISADRRVNELGDAPESDLRREHGDGAHYNAL